MYNIQYQHQFRVEGYPAMASSPINLSAALDLEASPEQLWPLLSDTGRIDRAIGIPAFERSTLEPDLSFAVRSHYMGVPVAWSEFPYEWVYEQWYQVERAFQPPVPVKRLMTRTTLSRLPAGGTHVDVVVSFEPRGLLGRAVAPLYIGQKM